MPRDTSSEEERKQKESLEKFALLEKKLRNFEQTAENAKRKPKRTDAEEQAYRVEREQIINEIVNDFRKSELNENMGYNQWVDAMLLLLNVYSAFAKAIYVKPPISLIPLPRKLSQALLSTRHENPMNLTELVQFVSTGIANVPGNIKSLTDQIGKPKDTSARKVQYAVEFANNGEECLARVNLFSKNGPLRAFIANHKAELELGIVANLLKNVAFKEFFKRENAVEIMPEIETAFLTFLVEWVNTQNLGHGTEYELRLDKHDKDPQNPNDLMDDVFLRMELLKPEDQNLPPKERLEKIQVYQQHLVDILNQPGEHSFDNFLAKKLRGTGIALEFEAKEPMPLPAELPAPRP